MMGMIKVYVIKVFVLCYLQDVIVGVMLRKDCPSDEVHKSCAFQEESTCWVNEERMDRTKYYSKRLPHCRSGCFCMKGLVRAYPEGPCIQATSCRDRALQLLLMKIPTDTST